jgi:hypothetical protein
MADQLNLRVCVIGAGPGGLAMARLLQLRGCAVTVLEKLDRAGGMCHSISYSGRDFDVGANYVTKDYREVRRVAKDMALKLTSDKAFQNQQSLNVETGQVQNAQTVIKSGHSMFAFLVASIRYFYFQFKYRKVVAAPGYAGVAANPDLMSYFSDWLISHGMSPLQKLLMIPITAMGYGTLDKVPTAHALRYINASRFLSMLLTGLNFPQRWPKRFVKGFGHLWQRVAAQLYVEYQTEILHVDRSGETVKVVTVSDGAEQTREFDRLVLGIPPNEALRFLDATEAEQALYSNDTILFNHYVVATATVKKFHWWVVNTIQAAPGDTGAYPPANGNPYIFGKQWKQSELTLYYAPIEEPVSEDDVRNRMEAISDLSNRAFPNSQFGDWYTYSNWPHYFPRVSLSDMSSFRGGKGWYDQVEELQGQNNTYLCHGIVSFELVELIMRYARHLIDTHFVESK